MAALPQIENAQTPSTCPPSSAIARFLDGNTALRTVAPPEQPPIAMSPLAPSQR